MKNDEAQPSPEAAREEFFRGVEPEAAQNSLADREAEWSVEDWNKSRLKAAATKSGAYDRTVRRRALSFWRFGGSVHSSRVALAISARKKLSFMPPSMMSHGSTGSAERSRNT